MKLEIKYGLILFAIMLIPTMAFIFFDFNIFSGLSLWGSMLFTLVFLVFAGIQKRKSLGGYMDYGQAFKTIFLVSIISAVPSVIVSSMVYANNPKAKVMLSEYGKSSNDWVAGMMSKVTGESKEEILLKMDQDQEKQDEELSSLSTVTMLFGAVLNSLIYALILSVFVKKKPKVT